MTTPMKPIIAVGAIVTLGVVALMAVSILSSTRHLTKTPPVQRKLVNGTNALSFPVVQGRYLLRIGRAQLEPVGFQFCVRGLIETPAGSVNVDETYLPSPEVLSRQISGGYVSRILEISSNGQVGLKLVASFPESEELICTFQGIK